MKKLALIPIFLMLFPAILSSESIGFYKEPYQGYRTAEGKSYSHTEFEAASSLHPVGTLLEMTSASGEKFHVYVSDKAEYTGDRTTLLNLKSAEAFSLLEKGQDELDVAVILPSDEEKMEDTGWYSINLGPFPTNKEAYDTFCILKGNGLEATAYVDNGNLMLSIGNIVAYSRQEKENLLTGLGLPFSTEIAPNPYN